MEIKQLQYFAEIVREGNFTHAARTLHIGQPALSKHVQALERELGVTLLLRHSGGARPTEAGRRLEEMARSLLAYVDEIGDEVRKAASNHTGTITLGLSPSLVPALAEHVTARLSAHYPGLRVEIVEALPMFLCEWLDLGRLDVGIFTPWQPYDVTHPLRFVDVGLDEMLLVGREGRSLGNPAGPVSASALSSLRLALTKGFAGLLRTREDLANALRGLELEIDSTQLIRDLAVRGEYWSILPYSFVREDVSHGLVQAFKLEPAFYRTVVAATRPGKQKPAGELIVDAVRARLSELSEQQGAR